MPTVNRIGPYRFFFYSGDWQEPRHVHVERDDATAKFWLDPVHFARSSGFRSPELNKVQKLVEQHAAEFRRTWDEYFRD